MFWTTHDDLFVQPEIDRRRAPFTGHQDEFRRELRRTAEQDQSAPVRTHPAIALRFRRFVAGVGRTVRSARAAV